jgi:hypothetical protein
MISRACVQSSNNLTTLFCRYMPWRNQRDMETMHAMKKSSMIKVHVLLLPKHIKTYKCSLSTSSHNLPPAPLTLQYVCRVGIHIFEEILVLSAEWRDIDSNIHCYAPRRRNMFLCCGRRKSLLSWCMQIFTTTYFIAELEMRWKRKSSHIRNWWWA